MISCYICHGAGHIAAKCPNRHDGRIDKHDGCYICGSYNHHKGHHEGYSHKAPRCSRCQMYGHDEEYCEKKSRYQRRSKRNSQSKLNMSTSTKWKESDSDVQVRVQLETVDGRSTVELEKFKTRNSSSNDSLKLSVVNHLATGGARVYDKEPSELFQRSLAQYRATGSIGCTSLKAASDGKTIEFVTSCFTTFNVKPTSLSPPPRSKSNNVYFIGTSTHRALDWFKKARENDQAALEEL